MTCSCLQPMLPTVAQQRQHGPHRVLEDRNAQTSMSLDEDLQAHAHHVCCRLHPGEQRVTANSSARFGSPDPFQAGERPLQAPGAQPAMDILSRPTSPDGLGGGLYSSYTMGAGLEGLICASPPPTRDGPLRWTPDTMFHPTVAAARRAFPCTGHCGLCCPSLLPAVGCTSQVSQPRLS